jgi:hypothetical protein
LRRWIWLNGLSLAMFGAFGVFLVLQSIFGWQVNNEDLTQHGRQALSYLSYLGSGHFIEATFENWESEFLQMGSYVLLTAYLVQKGSPESNPLDGADDPVHPDSVRPDSPEPVKRRGLALTVYQHSLSIALFGMFALSFLLHALGATAERNNNLSMHGQSPEGFGQILLSTDFWFQSMQNWQSEFLSVGVLIVFSIFLRQRGSSQSKKLVEPHSKTGE